MAMSPGTYLRLRREAAELTIADVAEKIGTLPFRIPLPDRSDWIARIEADTQPLDPPSITALGHAYSFDFGVLEWLIDLHVHKADLPHPRLCRVCACSEWDPCIADLTCAGSCHWVGEDLCSACVGKPDPAAATSAPIAPPANDQVVWIGYDPGENDGSGTMTTVVAR